MLQQRTQRSIRCGVHHTLLPEQRPRPRNKRFVNCLCLYKLEVCQAFCILLPLVQSLEVDCPIHRQDCTSVLAYSCNSFVTHRSSCLNHGGCAAKKRCDLVNREGVAGGNCALGIFGS